MGPNCNSNLSLFTMHCCREQHIKKNTGVLLGGGSNMAAKIPDNVIFALYRYKYIKY